MSRSRLAATASLPGFRYNLPIWHRADWQLSEPQAEDSKPADTSASSDYDSPWKDALELYFEPAIALLMPALHAQVDWSRSVTFLDKEFQAISHRLPSGRKVVDKLAKVHGRNGKPMFILIHIEVQGGRPRPRALRLMAERMAFYAFRIRDGFRSRAGKDSSHSSAVQDDIALFSLAVLTNSSGGPPVLRQEWEFLGCSASFQCPVIHLGQWWERWDELEAMARHNPFAVVIMAQLRAHRSKAKDRLQPSIGLLRMMHDYGYSREAILSVMRLVEWMIALPPELEPAYEQAWRAIEQEYAMSYVLSFERNALARGRAEGKVEGKAEGKAEGEIDGMLSMLQEQLTLKYGPLPEWADIRLKDANTDTLMLWSRRVLFANSLEAVFEA